MSSLLVRVHVYDSIEAIRQEDLRKRKESKGEAVQLSSTHTAKDAFRMLSLDYLKNRAIVPSATLDGAPAAPQFRQ